MANSAAANKVVAIKYVLTIGDGKEVDSSGDEPFEYLHGHDNIVPGLERELQGKSPGAKFKVAVSPEDGYGVIEPELTRRVPRSAFPKKVEVGMQFAMEDDDGGAMPIWVKEVGKDKVLIDMNHPLAGETLTFDVEVLGVRAATAEELAHGHVHSGDHHHH
jgi:FKBP-type peptidyl-prolyl cis-trans isomerase SlyD